jgi:hypothetical protein
MGWTVSKTFGCKLVDEVSNGFNINGLFKGCKCNIQS